MTISVLILLIAIAFWGIIHSALASSFVKDMIGAKSVYRLAYNLFAALSFAPILYLMVVLPNRPLYSVPAPFSYVLYAGQILAALGLIVGFLQTDALSFAGLRQLVENEKQSALVTRGLYRYVRHPLYTFGLLFVWLSPTVTVNSLTVYVAATIYTIVGAYFEERRLLREFGQVYADYQRVTPMLIPKAGKQVDR